MADSQHRNLLDELSLLGRLHLQVRRLIEAAELGGHAARGLGGGGDFIEPRAWRSGDEMHRVDWRASARGDQLLLREQRAERRLQLRLLIDSSASMVSGEPVSKWRYSCWLALALAYAAKRAGDSVELFAGGGDSNAKMRFRSLSELDLRAEELEQFAASGGTDLASATGVLCSGSSRGLLVVVSDLLQADDAFWQALASQRQRGWHIVVLRVLAGDELKFETQGAVRFEGLEGEASLVVDAGAMRSAYLDELQRFDGECAEGAASAGARLVLCDTSANPLGPLRQLLEEQLP